MKPKQVKTGRPRKSRKGSYTWFARTAARAFREALEIMRGIDPTNPTEADRERVDEAWGNFGMWLYDCYDPDNPTKFLRQVVDELDGTLKHSPLDENICLACLDAWLKYRVLTYPRVKQALKERLKNKNGSLPADSSLRRSIKRLGFVLVDEDEVPKLT